MKIPLIRGKGFVPSSRVDEIITNKYISCLLVRKESDFKARPKEFSASNYYGFCRHIPNGNWWKYYYRNYF